VPLSQAYYNRVARTIFRALGSLVEPVDYRHKDTASDAFTTFQLRAKVWQPQIEPLTPGIVVAETVTLQLPTAAVAFTPTQYDQWEQASGAQWSVEHLRGGPGFPFWWLSSQRVA
jgi:hypothetical protein